MDERLQKLVNDFTKKFGLEHYQLETYSFHKASMYNGEVHYKCNLEFFPDATRDEAEDDLNPPGTAIIEYNLTTEKLTSVLFVNGQSFSTKIEFHDQTVREVANWIEQETGYRYDDHFFVTDTLDNGYEFKTDFHGIPSSPAGLIEVEFDHDGKLTFFILYDMHAINEDIKREKFTLTVEQIESIIQKQVILIQFPNEVTEKFVPVYAVNEVYIMNDGKRMIPYLSHERDEIVVNQLIEWTTALEGTIERKVIEPYSTISLEEAFSEHEPMMKPSITENQVSAIIQTVTDVLRTVQPINSGKWTLATIRSDEHFIEVICTWNGIKRAYLNRKFITLLDPTSFEVLNYIDNSELLKIFDSFTPAPEAKISQEEAYQKLFPFITLKPTYVYDLKTRQFQLCGLLDSTNSVDAVTGEIIPLEDI